MRHWPVLEVIPGVKEGRKTPFDGSWGLRGVRASCLSQKAKDSDGSPLGFAVAVISLFWLYQFSLLSLEHSA